MKTVYLAGKITNDPDYKEKFKAAEDFLNEHGGFAVLNPAILPQEGFEYAAYIRMSMAMLKECQAACFLPGWKDSPGARDEFDLAKVQGIDIYFLEGGNLRKCNEYKKTPLNGD